MRSIDPEMATPPVVVAVGVLVDGEHFLVSRRADDAHQGGLWEFPGGKVEPGETVSDALKRELREELGVELESAVPLMEITHRYPSKTVRLLVWRVLQFHGIPRGLEGQPVRWVTSAELRSLEFPQANRLIVEALMGDIPGDAI